MTTSDYFGGFGGRIWFERPNEPSSQTTAITGSSNIIINHVSSQNVTEPEETDGAVYISSVLWLTGITASLGAVLNIFVIFLIYKGGRQWKNHRHVYYVFTSVSALIFAGGTSTNSLAMATRYFFFSFILVLFTIISQNTEQSYESYRLSHFQKKSLFGGI